LAHQIKATTLKSKQKKTKHRWYQRFKIKQTKTKLQNDKHGFNRYYVHVCTNQCKKKTKDEQKIIKYNQNNPNSKNLKIQNSL
jgi:hypothetical protein